jgi:Trypsin-like peptidase domain
MSAYPNGINARSVQSIYIEVGRRDLPYDESSFGHGTAFLIADDDPHRFAANSNPEVLLVTAWHLFSGQNFFTKTTCGIPNFVRVFLPSKTQLSWQQFDLPLLDKYGVELFTQVKYQGNNCDVAYLRVNLPREDARGLYLNPLRALALNVASNGQGHDTIGTRLYVSGFPLKRGAQKLAITISGSIASEPGIDFEYDGIDYPFFLVSARTWSGQSGSPVYKFHGSTVWDSCQWSSASGGNPAAFAGIYTGRLNPPKALNAPSAQKSSMTEPNTADLGIVWHCKVLTGIPPASTSATSSSIEPRNSVNSQSAM